MSLPIQPPLPKDPNEVSVLGIYVPGQGIVAAQGGTVSTDASGVPTAPLVSSGGGGTQGVQQADLTATGTISAAQPVINTPVSNATVVLTVGQGQSAWKALLLAGTGGFTSGTTIVADQSVDGGTTWVAMSFRVAGSLLSTPVQSVVGPGPILISGDLAAAAQVRVRCSVLNAAETIAVTLRSGVGVGSVGILSSIPTGTNSIGSITVQAVSGTALVADQTNSELRVSNYGKSTTAGDTAIAVDSSGNVGTNVVGALPAGTNNIGKVNIQASGNSLAIDNTNELRVSLYGKSTAAGDTAIAVDSSGFVETHQKLGGSDLSNTNPMPSQLVAQANYVALTSPAAQTNAGTDTTYTFSSQVNGIVLQNNSGANLNFAFDVAATAGSLLLATGQTFIYSKKVTAVHLLTSLATNVNGASSNNIVLLGEL